MHRDIHNILAMVPMAQACVEEYEDNKIELLRQAKSLVDKSKLSMTRVRNKHDKSCEALLVPSDEDFYRLQNDHNRIVSAAQQFFIQLENSWETKLMIEAIRLRKYLLGTQNASLALLGDVVMAHVRMMTRPKAAALITGGEDRPALDLTQLTQAARALCIPKAMIEQIVPNSMVSVNKKSDEPPVVMTCARDLTGVGTRRERMILKAKELIWVIMFDRYQGNKKHVVEHFKLKDDSCCRRHPLSADDIAILIEEVSHMPSRPVVSYESEDWILAEFAADQVPLLFSHWGIIGDLYDQILIEGAKTILGEGADYRDIANLIGGEDTQEDFARIAPADAQPRAGNQREKRLLNHGITIEMVRVALAAPTISQMCLKPLPDHNPARR